MRLFLLRRSIQAKFVSDSRNRKSRNTKNLFHIFIEKATAALLYCGAAVKTATVAGAAKEDVRGAAIEKATAALLYCGAAVAVRGAAIRALLYGPHISKILCLFGVYSTKTTRSKILNKIPNYRNAEFH